MWAHQFGIDLLQRLHRVTQTAGRINHANQQHQRANQHHHTLHGVVQHAGAETAKRGVQRDGNAENQQAIFVFNARSGFQQSCATDELHGNRTDKRHQQTDAGNPDHCAVLIARLQHIIQRDRIISPGKNREFFT
ncbi:hypothetical protein D3C80_1540230 [compost metagenome]